MLNFNFVVRSINYRRCVITRNMSLLKNLAYVNGHWQPALNSATFEVRNPADNSVVGNVPDMSEPDVQIAIEIAYEKFYEWSERTAKDRAIILRKWYDLMEKNTEELAKIMTLESGKPITESRAEIKYGNSFVDWFSEEARRVCGEIVPSPVKSKQILLYKQPIGVVGLITPWNFPHAMITRKAAAALAVGCTCVVKPAEDTPLTALAIAQLAHDAGVPHGVFNVITSSRKYAANIGNLFCTSSRIAGISFTGSTQVGKLLYKQSAGGIKRIGLELGGNAPFIVFESADIDKAVDGAMASKFRNCGQTCVSSNRFIISDKIFDTFVDKLKARIEKLVIGNGINEQVTIGPVINKAQADKVDMFVKDAIQKGAKVITGGKPASKYGELFYEPTLLTNIQDEMLCYNEEIFGPVVACVPFKTETEAVNAANNTPRGLAGYFYSNDVGQIFRVARHLEMGMIGVNEGIISTAEAAFGGVKESGIGREGSHHGIDEYVYIKYLCLGNMS